MIRKARSHHHLAPVEKYRHPSDDAASIPGLNTVSTAPVLIPPGGAPRHAFTTGVPVERASVAVPTRRAQLVNTVG